MSLARVQTVRRSAKAYRCEHCGAELPVGSEYRHYKVGFRSRFRHIRCMDAGCTPRRSELESSKLAGVYAAAEGAEDEVRAAESLEDIQSALEEFADAVREVADEYREAATDDRGVTFNADAEEKAEALESALTDVDSFDTSEFESDCEVCDGSGEVAEQCEACEGSGSIPDEELGSVDCLACDGSGELTETVECPECNGEGSTVDLDEAREAAIEAVQGVDA